MDAAKREVVLPPESIDYLQPFGRSRIPIVVLLKLDAILPRLICPPRRHDIEREPSRTGDVIDIRFVKKELNKVKFINNVDGVLYPISQTPADQKQLKNFKWLDKRRPKSKLELFE